MTAQKSERCKQRTVGDGEETVTGEQSSAEEEIKGGGEGWNQKGYEWGRLISLLLAFSVPAGSGDPSSPALCLPHH